MRKKGKIYKSINVYKRGKRRITSSELNYNKTKKK